jgi:hypothetical protein
MSDIRGRVLGIAFVLVLLAGWPRTQPVAAQPKPDEQGVGRYKMIDLQVGRFIYRFLLDTATADQWVWVNGEWERPEPPRDGVPWKGLKPIPGRFQLLSQIPGELDANLYLLDTITGQMWLRQARNRSELLAPRAWEEVPVPGRTKPKERL